MQTVPPVGLTRVRTLPASWCDPEPWPGPAGGLEHAGYVVIAVADSDQALATCGPTSTSPASSIGGCLDGGAWTW